MVSPRIGLAELGFGEFRGQFSPLTSFYTTHVRQFLNSFSGVACRIVLLEGRPPFGRAVSIKRFAFSVAMFGYVLIGELTSTWMPGSRNCQHEIALQLSGVLLL